MVNLQNVLTDTAVVKVSYNTLQKTRMTELYLSPNSGYDIDNVFFSTISDGKAQDVAGIFGAWDINNDRRITVEEVGKQTTTTTTKSISHFISLKCIVSTFSRESIER